MSFFLCARVLVLIDCLSPLWSEMMRSIVSHSPWRYKFLFPRRIPMFCKNTDQNLQRVVKACMCGSCCHCFMLPLQECVSKQQQLYCRTRKFWLLHFAPWGWGWQGAGLKVWELQATAWLHFFHKTSTTSYYLFASMNHTCWLLYVIENRLIFTLFMLVHLRHLWLDFLWMWWDYESPNWHGPMWGDITVFWVMLKSKLWRALFTVTQGKQIAGFLIAKKNLNSALNV